MTVTDFVELIVGVCVGFPIGYATRHYLIDYAAEHYFGGRHPDQ